MPVLLKDSSMREYIKAWANTVCHMANVETWRLSSGREAREGCFQHGEGALPRGVLTSKSLLQIQNLALLGRKEQDGECLQHEICWLAFTFPLLDFFLVSCVCCKEILIPILWYSTCSPLMVVLPSSKLSNWGKLFDSPPLELRVLRTYLSK